MTTYLDAIIDGKQCLRPTDPTDDRPGPSMLVCGEAVVEGLRWCPECRKRLLIPVAPIIGKPKRKAA